MAYATVMNKRMTSRTSSSPMGASFTSAGAENPMLTIVALAIRQADYLADQLGKKEI